MKNIVAFLALLTIFLVWPLHLQAIGLSNAMIRMDRQKFSTSPGNILITAMTSENVTENGIRVVAGSSWSISSTASNFTTSTAGLPSGVTAWPGVGTASNVAGNTITFPGNDINAGTTYGFYITGGISTNPSSATTDGKIWQVSTLVGGSPSSTSQVGVALSANDQITITGQVLPAASVFDVAIESLTTGTQFAQDEEIQYQITYGSNHIQSTNLTVQAEWSLGTIQGGSSPSVEILEYVTGSASNAYGSTAPVIDTVNRTITWSITSFPANTTNQTVTFTLRTVDGYTGASIVDFDVIGRITQPVAVPDETVTLQYLYSATETGGSSSGGDKKSCDQRCESDNDCDTSYCLYPDKKCRNRGNPSSLSCQSLPSSSTASDDSGTTVSTALTITNVSIASISEATAQVLVNTNINSTAQIKFGLSPTNLNQVSVTSTNKSRHALNLLGLQPKTRYYFKVIATNGSETRESELFTFSTATTGTSMEIAQFFVTSNGVALYSSDVVKKDASVTIPIPFTAIYEVGIRLREQVTFKTANLIAENKDDFTRVFSVPIVESRPGLWTAQISSRNASHLYQLLFSAQDFEGNIINFPLASIRGVQSMKLIDNETGKGVERGRVEFFRFNGQTQLYEVIRPQTLLRENPVFSEYDGNVPVVLPIGKYKVKIDALAFQTLEHEFDIDESTVSLPQLRLTPTGFSVLNIGRYYTNSVMHIFDMFLLFIRDMTRSQAIVTLANTGILSLLAIVSIVSFSARTHVKVWEIPSFLYHSVQRFFPQVTRQKQLFSAKIVDKKTQRVLPRATLQLFDQETGQVVLNAANYKNGYVHLNLPLKAFYYTISVPGYLVFEGKISPNQSTDNSQNEVETIELEQQEDTTVKVRHLITHLVEHILDSMFETFLLLSFLGQILFTPHLGFFTVLPYLCVSMINLVIWWLYEIK